MSAQCLGITVKDTADGLLSFEGGAGKFHIPYRCDRVATGSKGLCSACCVKEEKTAAKVAQMKPGNTTIGGQLPSFLNGRVGEPIPYWTRLYDGAWYRLKVEGGATLSEATMGRVKKAVAEAYQGETQPPPAPMPDGKGARKGRKKKEVAAAPATPTVMEALVEAAAKAPTPTKAPAAPPAEVPAAVPKPSVAPTPAKPAKKVAAAPKKKAAAPPPSSEAPVARISTESEPTPVEDIVTATVKKAEIAGRSVYLEAQKGKVYDLKFHYLGRWDSKKEKIVAHPDSDAEC